MTIVLDSAALDLLTSKISISIISSLTTSPDLPAHSFQCYQTSHYSTLSVHWLFHLFFDHHTSHIIISLPTKLHLRVLYYNINLSCSAPLKASPQLYSPGKTPMLVKHNLVFSATGPNSVNKAGENMLPKWSHFQFMVISLKWTLRNLPIPMCWIHFLSLRTEKYLTFSPLSSNL